MPSTLHGVVGLEREYITVDVRSVYGELKAYPACPTARIFADIAGTKTLRARDLHLIYQLGFRIVARGANWTDVA